MLKKVLKALNFMNINCERQGNSYLLDFMQDHPSYAFRFLMCPCDNHKNIFFTVEFLPRWDLDFAEHDREAIIEFIESKKSECKHILFVRNKARIFSRHYSEFEGPRIMELYDFRNEALKLIGEAVEELGLFHQEHECSSEKQGKKCQGSSGICESITHGYDSSGSLNRSPHGYWEYPCYACARKTEAYSPQFGENWPFVGQLDRICSECRRMHDSDVSCEDNKAEIDDYEKGPNFF